MKDSRFIYLFQAYFNKTASVEEREELMVLLEEAENDEQLKLLLADAWENIKMDKPVFDDNEREEMLEYILQAKKDEEPVPVIPHKKFFNWTKVAAAAAIFIAVFTAIYFLVNRSSKEDIPLTVIPVNQKDSIVPGGDKAILTLADGSAIVLDSLHSQSLPQQGNTRIVKLNAGSLAYNAGAISQQTLYNTLSTPGGGQFQLVLPDGSKVWLNSSSSIRFPTAFNGDERKVELTGEAYFEIAKNADQPFKVTVKEMEVRVIGTHFNIMAYDDEKTINTTLIEGSVKVTKGLSEKALRPGQQSRIGLDENIKVTEADIEEVIAWKNGYFQFNGNDIETIMRQMARWYDVKVFYKDKIPDGHFSGIVSRKNNISQVLKILEGGGVQFRIEGKKVTVL